MLALAGLLLLQVAAAAETPQRPPAFGIKEKVAEIQQLLDRKMYKQGLAEAKAFNQAVPDELSGYALMADAQMALGQMAEAEKSIQWMLDLRRNDPRGMIRAGRFRALTGDAEGALLMFEQAFQRMAGSPPPERAALLLEMARIRSHQGHKQEAQRLIAMAQAEK